MLQIYPWGRDLFYTDICNIFTTSKSGVTATATMVKTFPPFKGLHLMWCGGEIFRGMVYVNSDQRNVVMPGSNRPFNRDEIEQIMNDSDSGSELNQMDRTRSM